MGYRLNLPLVMGKPATFVALNGSDERGNGSLANPWRTIRKGVSELRPGGSLVVRGGIYVEGEGAIRIVTPNTTVSNYPGEQVIIDAQRRFPTPGESQTPVLLLKANGVTVSGITVKNSNGRGFTINEADGCTVRDCVSSWSRNKAILCLKARNALVENCLFEYASQSPDGSGGTAVFRECHNATLKNCTIRYSTGEGIIYFLGTNGRIIGNTVYDVAKVLIYFENANGMWIDSNKLFYTAGYSQRGEGIHQFQEHPDNYGMGVPTGSNTIINNIVVGTQHNLSLTGGTHNGKVVPGYGLKDIKVANNTFVNGTNACVKIALSDDHNADENSPSWFTNNILIQDDDKSILWFNSADLVKFTFANNLFSKDPGSDKVRGENSLIGVKAQLVNPRAALNSPSDFRPENYQLTSTSPAIGAGTSAYPPRVERDLFGNLRDGQPDIGAHEFQARTLQADFTADPLQGGAPLAVSFQDQSISTETITGWFWDFGDGRVSEEQNPTHIYEAGNYVVTLRVSNQIGTAVRTQTISIAAATDDSPLSNSGADAESAYRATGAVTAATFANSFRRFLIVAGPTRNEAQQVLALGLQFPDERCILYSADRADGSTLCANQDEAVDRYAEKDAGIRWLD